jgi:uncharacterized membrane protein
MSTIRDSIEVNVPLRTAYDQWTQFEEFPRFMEGVESVTQLDDTHLQWTAEMGGQRRTWRAEITRQEPDQGIAWQSTEGARNAGAITFEAIDDDTTRVNLQLEIEPEGALEKAGDVLGVVDRSVKGDLERFKEFIESRRVPTGAWRGSVDQGQTR